MESTLRSAVRLAADELAEALLPAVLSRLRGQTDRLRALAGRISEDPRAAVADPESVESLEADQTLGRRIGWCLGVLAAANGTDLLLARRERDGLREMTALVALALPDHPLQPSPDALPGLASGVGQGWELPFLVSFAFVSVARWLPAGAPLRWEQETGTDPVVLGLERSEADRTSEALLAELVGLVPGAQLVLADGVLALRIPRAWLELRK